jgi:predicted nucleic acid-binding protein
MARIQRKEVAASRRATRGVTFDTGMLIALERRNASALALLRACRLSRARITIPTTVVAEWWRGSHQSLLDSGLIEPLLLEVAKQAGELLSQTGRSNAVDATVVASAARRGDIVVTGDRQDLSELAAHAKGVSIEGIAKART